MPAGEKKKKDPVSRRQQLHLPLVVSGMCSNVALSQCLLCLKPTASPVMPHTVRTSPRIYYTCRSLLDCMRVNGIQTRLETPPHRPRSPRTTFMSLCWPAECPQAGNVSLHVLQSRQACRGEQHGCGPLHRVAVGLYSMRSALLQQRQLSPLSKLIFAVCCEAVPRAAAICTCGAGSLAWHLAHVSCCRSYWSYLLLSLQQTPAGQVKAPRHQVWRGREKAG